MILVVGMTMEIMVLICGLQQQIVQIPYLILMILKQSPVGLLVHHGILIMEILEIIGIIHQITLETLMPVQILGLKTKEH